MKPTSVPWAIIKLGYLNYEQRRCKIQQMGGKRGRVKEVDLDDNGQAVSP